MSQVILDNQIIVCINEICQKTGLRPDYVVSRGLALFIEEYNAEIKKRDEFIQQKLRS